MGLFGFAAKLVTAPIRVVAVPLDVVERYIDGREVPRSQRMTSDIHEIADAIEETVADLDD